MASELRRRIPDSFVQELLKRTDLLPLIQSRVVLKRRGADYWGLCPFHDEKSPSFKVSPSKQFYYCFGCMAYGNAIGFLMAFDGANFREAVTALATPLGLDCPEDKAYAEKHAPIYDLLSHVTHYYRSQLKHSAAAVTYLKSRGITGEIAQRFAIGYAPSTWDHLQDSKNLVDQQAQLIAHGLLIQKDRAPFVRFRDRIMFPIRDIKGQVIAFGGRMLGTDMPKYLNSPETSLFHKSHQLYGLYEAQGMTRRLSKILVVEGYFDVLVLHQYQMTYAVATLGTAVTAQHLQTLLRWTSEVIYCFDGDKAGYRAAWRALRVSLPLMRDDIRIRFLFLPIGEDPDSFIRKVGRENFEKKIEEAQSLSAVFFKRLRLNEGLKSLEDKASSGQSALNMLNTMPRGVFRELLMVQLAGYLGVSRDQLSQWRPNRMNALPAAKPSAPVSSLLAPTDMAVAILLQYPHFLSKIEVPPHFSEFKMPGVALLTRIIDFLRNDPDVGVGRMLLAWDPPEERSLISKLAAYPLLLSKEENLLAELQGALFRLNEQTTEYLIEILIKKAKIDGLSEHEQQILNRLLMKARHELPMPRNI